MDLLGFVRGGHIINGGTKLRLTSIRTDPSPALTSLAAVGRAKGSALRAARRDGYYSMLDQRK